MNPLKHQQVSTLHNEFDLTHHSSLPDNSTTPVNISTKVIKNDSSIDDKLHQSTFFDINDLNAMDIQDSLLPPRTPTDDYLLSSNQLARLLKKKQISECFVINFISKDSDNTLITPIYPSTFTGTHELNNLEVTDDNVGEQ